MQLAGEASDWLLKGSTYSPSSPARASAARSRAHLRAPGLTKDPLGCLGLRDLRPRE